MHPIQPSEQKFDQFLVDANDRERMDETLEELQKLLSEDDLRNARMLVLANKQDLPSAMNCTGTFLSILSLASRNCGEIATQSASKFKGLVHPGCFCNLWGRSVRRIGLVVEYLSVNFTTQDNSLTLTWFRYVGHTCWSAPATSTGYYQTGNNVHYCQLQQHELKAQTAAYKISLFLTEVGWNCGNPQEFPR